MFYIKLIGDDPVIIDGDVSLDSDRIVIGANKVYFLVSVMTHQGPAQTPISAEDQGLKGSELTFLTRNITMMTELKPESEIIAMIKQLNTQKSGIITPIKKIITP